MAVGNFVGLSDSEAAGGANLSIQGVASEAKISFVRLAVDGDAGGIHVEEVIAGLNKFLQDAQSNPAVAPDVVNMSIGFPLDNGLTCSDAAVLQVATKALVAAGITVVAASGNDSHKNNVAAPACFSEVMSVGATEFLRDSQKKITGEQVAAYSQSSDQLDIVAPGTGLSLATPDPDPDHYLGGAASAGTSFSSPIVAGAVLLVKEANPKLTPSQIQSVLTLTGDDVKDPASGEFFPRINVQAAVNYAPTAFPEETTTTVAVTQPPVTQPPATQPPVTSPTVPASQAIPAPTAVGSSDVAVAVQGQSVTQSNSVSATSSLAYTGSSSTQLLFSALWILCAGIAMLCYKEGFSRLALARAQARR